MKLILIAALAATAFAQEAKVAAPKATPPAISHERLFTSDEVEKLTLVSAQIEVLRARFKVDELEAKYKEFQAELVPIAAKQEAILKAACTAIGVSEEKMKSGGCGISLGVDATGKAINGQDGKPVASRVWVVDTPKSPVAGLPAIEAKK